MSLVVFFAISEKHVNIQVVTLPGKGIPIHSYYCRHPFYKVYVNKIQCVC